MQLNKLAAWNVPDLMLLLDEETRLMSDEEGKGEDAHIPVCRKILFCCYLGVAAVYNKRYRMDPITS